MRSYFFAGTAFLANFVDKHIKILYNKNNKYYGDV